MRFDLVIFDCDGVLIDSEPLANRVFSERLAREGLHLSPEETMRRFVGRTRQGCLDLAEELLGRKLPERFGTEWDEALFEAMRTEVRAINGVVDVLRGLRIPYCVASNGTPVRMRIALEACGLLPLFEGRMFTSADVPRPKPAPDLFLHAARSLGADPSRCAVIEDTPTGVAAGLSAGMIVFGYAAGNREAARTFDKAGARPFDRMQDLPALLAA
jgi:HAD superfamily hydrolase (TIGR01509 family)